MPVTLSRVRSIHLKTDGDNDGFADAGDVIRTTLVIQNTGTSNATNLLVNDPIAGTTFFGVVNISPLAFNDAFTAVGNTVLRVGGAANVGSGPSSQVVGNLLTNDTGSVSASDGVPGFTLDAVSNLDTAHGTVNIFSDGSFNYISDAGYEGADSFTYTIHDAGLDGISGNSDDLTSTATVAITVTGQVWYVDSAAAPGTGTGTSTNPFGSLSSATAADSSGDYIYVKGSVTGTAVLETGEHLIGTGSSLDVAGFHLADAGSRSTVSGSSGFTVTLAGGGTGNNEIAGINIISTGGAANHGITGTSFGNLTINNVTIDASGQGLVLTTGGIVAGSTGLVSTDSDGGTNNVALTGVTGTLALGTGALSGATGSSFLVSGGTVTTTYSGNITQANNAALLDVQGGHATGTLTFSTGTLSATNGTGLQFNNADGTYNLNGTNTMNGGDAGVDITNGSSGNFSFSTNSSITNPTGIGFRVDGGNGNIDYNGTLAKTSDGRVIDVQNHSGGTVSFDGTVSSTSSSDGVLLATNTGTIINFTNTLTINTSTSNTTGFAATGGGTVSASGSGNTINSGQGTALNVSNTNIGAADMIFTSINSSGGTATGIILDTTGSAGGLHVIGTGSAGSGGTIANKTGLDGSNTTGVGIYLNNTAEVFLDRMQLNGFGNFAIKASDVNGFTLDHSVINGNNGDSAGADEGAILFTNSSGTVTIQNSNISGGFEDNLRIFYDSATPDTAIYNIFTNIFADLQSGNNALVNLRSMSTASASTNVTFNIGSPTNAALGNTFDNSANQSATPPPDTQYFADGILATFEGNGMHTLNVDNNTFFKLFQGLDLASGFNADVDYRIYNNTITFTEGVAAIAFGTASTSTASSLINALIEDNDIGNATHDSGSRLGLGIVGDFRGEETARVTIHQNIIQHTEVNGIQFIGQGAANGDLHLRITNNTVSGIDDDGGGGFGVIYGIEVTTNAAPSSHDIFLTISGNDSFNINAFDIRIRQATASNTFSLEDFAGNGSLDTSVEAYLAAQNPGNTTDVRTGGSVVAYTTMNMNNTNTPAPFTPLLAPTPPPAPAGSSNPKGDATGGQFTTPVPSDPATPPPAEPVAPVPAGPAVVDDGILSQAELNLVVEAAIQRWADAGASADEIAAMRAVTVTVENMMGLSLGASEAGSIRLDDNAAGFNWFIDATPGEDSEYAAGENGLTALPGTVAAIRVDLLTTIMHELGHQIGLEDTYAAGDAGELMYGFINPGQRRLPDAGDVAQASGTPVAGTDFALAPVTIGTLLPGQTITVQWDATVDPHFNQVMPTFNNVSTITGNDGAASINVTSNSNTLSLTGPNTTNNIVLDTLTLGGTIWLDNGAGGGTINNGVQDGAEAGITGVTLSLYADADNNNVADGAAIATFATLAGGAYSFANLAPGNYLVTVDAANFTGGGVLVNRVTAPGTDDPDDNDNNDDNGIFGGGAVSSLSITLAQDTEPTQDASLKFDVNNTLDFGFVPLNQAPVNSVPGTQTINEDASRVFNAAGGNLISISDVDAGTGNMTVTLTVTHGTLTPVSGGGAVIGNSGTATVTINGTLTQVNAALNGLTYTPTGDFNGSDTLTITTNDNGNLGADPGNTGTATSEEDSDPITINITAINDAPTVINGATQSSTTIPEDQPLAAGQSVTSLFDTHFSDAADQVAGGSTANTLAGIAVSANGSSGATGQWQYSTNGGGSWQNIGAVTDATARLYNAGTLIRFNPTLDYNGAEPTLTVHLVDTSGAAITDNALVNLSGGGATGGTTRYSSGIVDLGGSITAVNDAPVNAKPGTQTINEDATLTFSTAGGNVISISDVDAAPGTLTVTLAVVNGQLTLASLVGLSFSGGSDGTDDTSMTFTGSATDINAALNGLLYETTLDYNGTDTLTITTNDNGNTGTPGALQDVDMVTINITAVPDIANDSFSFNEDSGTHTLTMPNNDTFENPGRSITAVTQGLHGFVSINDNNTLGDTTDDYVVYTQAADYNGADSFTYTVTSGGVTETATVNVSIDAVADATDDSPTVAEDSGTTTIDVIANDSFENGGFSITAVTQGLHGTVTIIDGPDADLNPDYVTYTPTADYNGSDSFTYTVTSGGVTETATVNVTVTAIADIADDSVDVVPDSGVNALNLLANDSFENAGRAITAVGAALHGTTAIDTHGDADPTNDSVTYMPTGGYVGPDTFTYTVTSGGVTETATVTVNVAPSGSAPVIDLDGGAPPIDNTALYTEQAAPTVLAGSLTVADADDTNIESATVQVTTGFIANFDYLTVDGATGPDTMLGISFNYVAATGILTLTGSAPLADYQAVLRLVGFESTSDDPGTSRQVTWRLNDGTTNSAIATTTITVTPVNDEPTLTATAVNPTFTEDGAAVDVFTTPIVASTIEATQTFTSLTLTVTNVTDGAAEVLNIDGSNLALTDANSVVGTATNGLTVSVSVTGSTATVSFLGANLSAAQLQTLVDSLTYTNTSQNPTDANRVVTITTLVDSGSNVPDNDNTTTLSLASTVNVNPTNDAATITGTVIGDVTEAGGIDNGTPGTPTATADLGATDPDNPSDLFTATVSPQDSANGYGTYTVTTAGVWTYTLDDNDAAVEALLGVATLTDTFVVTTQDGTPQTVTITIHAQDDAPRARPDAVTTPETTVLNGNVISSNGSGPDNDPDSGGGVTVSAVNGAAVVGMQITLGSGALLTVNANGTFAYDPNHIFDTTPAAASGASNTQQTDIFNYTLTGGGTAQVTVTITGVDSNDILLGTAGVDVLLAGIGNDQLHGGAGADHLFGGTGNDLYFITDSTALANEALTEGTDSVLSSVRYVLPAGSEIEILSTVLNTATTAIDLFGNEFANTIIGNAGANLLMGFGGADVVQGLGGDDQLYGGNAADQLEGGDGNDVLVGDDGDDLLFGGDANDQLFGGNGADQMFGGLGNDLYFITDANGLVYEAISGGSDTVYSSVNYVLPDLSEIEILSTVLHAATTAIDLFGNGFGNTIAGNAGANLLMGYGGADVLVGMGGDDRLYGGMGGDRLNGDGGHDILVGDEGDDLLFGGDGDDQLFGGTGADQMSGGIGDDLYFITDAAGVVNEAIGEGNDTVYSSVSYTLTAGAAVETLSTVMHVATTAIDLTGNEFANVIVGNAGANTLNGGAGNDELVGLAGADTYQFTTALGPLNIDKIDGFETGIDKIALDDAVFTGLGLGALAPGAFVLGTTAQDADDRIIYDQTTGALYFDADGNGIGAAIQFATLQPALPLAATDFVVI